VRRKRISAQEVQRASRDTTRSKVNEETKLPKAVGGVQSAWKKRVVVRQVRGGGRKGDESPDHRTKGSLKKSGKRKRKKPQLRDKKAPLERKGKRSRVRERNVRKKFTKRRPCPCVGKGKILFSSRKREGKEKRTDGGFKKRRRGRSEREELIGLRTTEDESDPKRYSPRENHYSCRNIPSRGET